MEDIKRNYYTRVMNPKQFNDYLRVHHSVLFNLCIEEKRKHKHYGHFDTSTIDVHDFMDITKMHWHLISDFNNGKRVGDFYKYGNMKLYIEKNKELITNLVALHKL